MPEEIFVLFLMLVLSTFGLTMTSMILRHRRKQKSGQGTANSDSSMTTSELESMMRRAVEDATAPLAAKIEDLEMEVIKVGSGQKQLQAHDASSRISLPEEDEILDVEPVAAPSKTRS
jgi:hypothetical protein